MRRLTLLTLAALCLLANQSTRPAAPRKLAIVIGNDHYRSTTPLQTAINDARAVQTVLHDYGFEVKLLTDASRNDIMTALSKSRSELSADSDLLVYYAGHGYYDAAVERAYWLPVDADVGNSSNWISADDIAANMKGTAARHILIVSDSCFSGTLTRGLNDAGTGPQSDRANTLAKLKERASREVLASGGNEPVSDGGGGQHSIFAAAFLRALEQTSPPQFAAAELFQEVREAVGGRSAQLPQLDAVRNSGHDGGSFIFSRVVFPVAGWSTAAVDNGPARSGNSSFDRSHDRDLLHFEKDGKWGLVDRRGTIRISPQYEILADFSEGLAAFSTQGRSGFLDLSGRVAIPAQFDSVHDFHEGLAPALSRPRGYGYIDRTGNWVIPQRYYMAGPFCEGLAQAVELKDSGWVTSFIDHNAQVVFRRSDFGVNACFSDGLLEMFESDSGLDGFLDKAGRWQIAPAFFKASRFTNGRAIVESASGFAFIDKSGHTVQSLPIIDFSDVVDDMEPGLFVVETKSGWGIINTAGSWVIPPRPVGESIFSIYLGVASVTTGISPNLSLGWIDAAGNYIWKPTR